MTSKISFFKLMKEDFKRRSWLVALIWLACFLLQPVLMLLRIDGMMSSVRNGYMEMSYAVESYRLYMGNGNPTVSVMVLVIALVTGISGYCHLHSKVKMDFYHSLPIPRRRFFFVQYLSGILMFVVPYVVCTLLCLLVGATNDLMTRAVVLVSAKTVMLRMLEFLSAYGTAILGTILTGKILTAILGTAVFSLYIPMVLMVWEGMKQLFFETYFSNMVEENSSLLSPLLAGVYAESRMNGSSLEGRWMVIGVGALIFWILVMTGFSIWLYSIRKTEAAEHSMAFPKMEGAVKVLLVIPLSLAVGLYIQTMLYTTNKKWFFVAAVCAVVLLSAVIEFIYHLSMRDIFRHKKQMLLAGAVTVGVALVFTYDIAGYDTYLPAKEDIGKMALYDDSINGSFYYPSTTEPGVRSVSYSAEDALDATLVKNFDAIYDLAKTGARGEEDREGEETVIYVEYRLKNGRREVRQYVVLQEDVEAAYEKLFSDPEFVGKVYPVLWKDTNEEIFGSDLYVDSAFGMKALDMKIEKGREFLKIYKEELQTVTYDDLKNHTLATLSLSVLEEEEYTKYGISSTSYTESGYPICEKFTNTIAFLKKEADMDVTRRLTIEDVTNIQVTDFREEENGLLTTVTDPEQIQEILDHTSYTPLYSLTDEDENIDIYIVLSNGDSATGRFYFKKGSVPEFLNREE